MALGDPEFNQRNFLQALVENVPGGLASLAQPTSVFSGNYEIGPDESGWAPKGPIMDLNTPQAGVPPTIPATPQAEPHEAIALAANHVPIPESHPLISAIDNNYADKKLMGPVEEIRKGIQLVDEEMVEKGRSKLAKMLLGERSFGQWYNDTVAGHSEEANKAARMAADVVMKEIAHASGLGMPSVQEATQVGLIKPEELLPGAQTETIPGVATPGYSGFTPQMEPIAAPQQAPVTKPIAGTRLTPFQEEIVQSRQKAIQSGLAYKAALAASRAELADEKALSERAKRETLLPEQIRNLKSQQESRQALDALRLAQVGLTEARTDWYKQLPGLRRELSGGGTPIEIEALKRVQTAIRQKTPIDKADWLVADRWLRKGLPPYMWDFMGRGHNRFTGEAEVKGKPFGWLGLPEPPSTTEEDRAEASAIDDDLLHQFGSFIGSLIQGIKGESKPEAEPETGLSAAEKSELEQLRKKHGRK